MLTSKEKPLSIENWPYSSIKKMKKKLFFYSCGKENERTQFLLEHNFWIETHHNIDSFYLILITSATFNDTVLMHLLNMWRKIKKSLERETATERRKKSITNESDKNFIMCLSQSNTCPPYIHMHTFTEIKNYNIPQMRW